MKGKNLIDSKLFLLFAIEVNIDQTAITRDPAIGWRRTSVGSLCSYWRAPESCTPGFPLDEHLIFGRVVLYIRGEERNEVIGRVMVLSSATQGVRVTTLGLATY